MIDNIRDVFRILLQYQGEGWYVLLYVAALVYLFIREKERGVRLCLVWIPLALLVIYLFPLYYRLYVLHLDSHGTYYRNLWMIPMSLTICYALCRLIYRHRVIGCIIGCAILVLCGSFTYTAADNSAAENPYHIPGYVVELADHMERDIPGVSVYACVPLETLFYIRQYDTDICLLYGREAAEPVWGYSNELYDAFELAEVLDWDAVLGYTRDESLGIGVASYFIIDDGRRMSGAPEDYGLQEVARADHYILYLDPAARAHVREVLDGTPYMTGDQE